MVLTFEQIKKWTPNNYQVVPHGMNNNLMPGLSDLDNTQMKQNIFS